MDSVAYAIEDTGAQKEDINEDQLLDLLEYLFS